MLDFSPMFGQATRLFHSPDVSELADPHGVGAMLTELGLDPSDLAGLSVEDALEQLAVAGADPLDLADPGLRAGLVRVLDA